MTKKTIQRQDIAAEFDGLPDAVGVLGFLWDKSRNTLTDGELAGIARAGGKVADTLEMLSDMLSEIGGVDGAASGSEEARYGRLSDSSIVLFPLAEWLKTQAALLRVSDQATNMLLQPSVFKRGEQ
jgi:hypothetical protein